jgi:hypothetical protein
MQDVAQKTGQAHTQAYAVVCKRMDEAVEELKTSLEPPNK